MSLWDDITGAWDAATSGDWSGAAGHVGDMVSGGTPSEAADLGSPMGYDYGTNAPSVTSGMWGAYTPGALGSGLTDFSGVGDFSGDTRGAGLLGSGTDGISMPASMPAASSSWGGENFPSNTNSGAVASGVADSGGAGLLGKAEDWAKKNPGLLNVGINALGTLNQKTSPAPATTAGYNAAAAGNAARASVGNSMINQAPFLANNAEAASKGAGANSSAALQQKLQQQGYKPGDAMYDSTMQQQNLGNRANDATAYAAGQGQMASQMNTGAGLLTPTNLSAYDSLGKSEDAQQGAQNKQNAGLAGDIKQAFDIYSNSDKKSDSGTPPIV